MKRREFDLNVAVRATRQDFSTGALMELDLDRDPFKQFRAWLDAAFRGGNELANAMVLSTVDAAGMPSSRVMLLRDVGPDGFTFFSNYESAKGKDLNRSGKASLLFFWPEMERQVRMQGRVEKISAEASDSYFASRPFESKVGAWVSRQSDVVKSRKQLDEQFEKVAAGYRGQVVPRPQNWGGYILRPEVFEFWQGRASRLHDRLRYFQTAEGWQIERLMP